MTQLNKTLLALTCGSFLTIANGPSQAEQRQWHYQYNSHGQVVLADGPRSEVDDSIVFQYDSAGNRVSTQNSLGHINFMSNHTERGQPQTIIDANGVETRLSYHPRGWILSRTVVSPDGDSQHSATTRYRYDQTGMLLETTLPDGATMINEYDHAQRLIAVSNAGGDRIEYTLDPAGNRLAEKSYNPAGTLLRDINRTYDELNRLIQVTGAAGQVTRFSYDRNGNRISHTDGNGNIEWRYHDALDRRSRTEAAHDHNVEFNHDQRHNLTSITDPRGLTTHYTLNGYDEVTLLSSPDTGTTSYHYDSAGNLLSRADASGRSATISYDALNRPLQKSHPDSTLDISYGYDEGSYGRGRLTSVNDASGLTQLDYDHRGNLVMESRNTGDLEFDLAYEYNLADRVTRITYPSGRTVDYRYSQDGQQTSVDTAGPEGARTVASEGQYLPFGPLASLSLGNGIQMIADYDQDYRLTSLTYDNALNRSYQYDPAGNITGIEDLRNSAWSQALGYDALNRLGTASGGYGHLSYSYDENSNRLSFTSGLGTDQYSYDTASNRLMSTSNWEFRYDNTGNLVARTSISNGDEVLYHYDDRNRLARVTERRLVNEQLVESELARYSYNHRHQRTRKQTPTGDTHYVYGQEGELLAEVDGNGNALREYIYFNKRPIAVASASFTYPPANPGPETLLDDTSAGTSSTGNWDQVRKKGAYGDYYHRSENNGNSYRWHPGTLNSSEYEIYGWWPRTRKNNPTAQYRIHHNDQVSTVTADQSQQGKQWAYLGTFRFSGDGNEYIELSDAGGKTAADGIRLVEILPPPPPLISTELYYIHGDHLGTPQTLTNQAKNIVWQANYQPFGQADINVAAVTNNLRFPGQYFDVETGLHQNYFRDYDVTGARYTQPDPLGITGSLNSYGYSKNNPFIYADPYGLAPSWVGPTGLVISTAGGTLALHPNPFTPPWIRATGIAMVGFGGALEVWDWATATDEVRGIVEGDLKEYQKNIEKINEQLESQNMKCE